MFEQMFQMVKKKIIFIFYYCFFFFFFFIQNILLFELKYHLQARLKNYGELSIQNWNNKNIF